jgi:predicted lipoprotein
VSARWGWVALGLTACAGRDDPRLPVLDALATGFVAAELEALAQATEALAATSPCGEGAAAARDGWWAARAPWKRVELVKFGPVVELPERVGPKLDDWPVNAAAVEALVAGDGPLDAAAFAAMGSATRGFPVVELLLWGEPLAAGTRRCEVATGALADVAAQAAALRGAWADPWGAWLTRPGGDGPYETVQAVVDEWVNRLGFTVENLRLEKLGKPLGDTSGGEVQADALESPYSGRSLTDARDALAGVAAAWEALRGLATPAVAEAVDERLDAAAVALAAVPEPLATAIVEDRAAVVAAQEALQALQVVLQVDVASALGVTVVFNDNDGD